MPKLYVGIDTAVVMGLAVYNSKAHTATVVEIVGTPIEQLTSINTFGVQQDDVIGFERLHVFVNAATIRNMSERLGFLKWALIMNGYQPKEVGPSEARALWSVKGKEGAQALLDPFAAPVRLTTNHADALLVALFLARSNHPTLALDGLTITVLEGINHEQVRRSAAREAKRAAKQSRPKKSRPRHDKV